MQVDYYQILGISREANIEDNKAGIPFKSQAISS